MDRKNIDKIIKELKDLKKHGESDAIIIANFEEKILKIKNPILSYHFVKIIKEANVSKHEKIIIDSGDLEANYLFISNISKENINKHVKAIVNSEQFLGKVEDCSSTNPGYRFFVNPDYYNYLILLAKNFPELNKKELEKTLINIRKKYEDLSSKNISLFCYFNSSIYLSYIRKFAKEVEGANIEKLGQIIINSGSGKENYLFAKEVPKAMVSEHENVVLADDYCNYIALFAMDVKGANIKKIEQFIIAKIKSGIKNKNYICDFITDCIAFAKNIPEANLDALADVIIETENPEYIYWFAKEVPNSNIEKLSQAIANFPSYYAIEFAANISNANVKVIENAIIESGNFEYIIEFAKTIKNADMSRLEDSVIKLKDVHKIFFYAKKIEGANVKKLGMAIVESGNFKSNYYFAKDVKGADVRAHGDVVIKHGNVEYNYYFAKEIPGADVRAHGDVVIKHGDDEYNYLFARDVKGADVKAHGDVVIKSGSVSYNYAFASEIPGADIRAHGKVVIASKDYFENMYFLKIPGCDEIFHRHVMGELFNVENSFSLIDLILDFEISNGVECPSEKCSKRSLKNPKKLL